MVNKHKNRTLFLTDFCYTPYKNIRRSGILCEGDKILAIGGASAFTREEDITIIELEGAYAMPGLIDTHIHGGSGFDSSRAAEPGTSIQDTAKLLVEHGITSFMPTVVAAEPDKMLANLSIVADLIAQDTFNSQPVGINVEGPFLNPLKKGSQIKKALKPIDLSYARDIIAAGKGLIKKMTFAPELENSEALIELLRSNDIQPSMGHSVASAEDAIRAIDAGATSCTHLFNGMPPLHQRDISLTTIALTDDRISIEIILDGRHLHPRMIDLACRCKPKDKVIGISDATQASGLLDGKYHIGGTEIIVKDGLSQTADGSLAGTTLTLDKGWHSLMTFSQLRGSDAAACVTINPALEMNLTDRGELLPGKRADIAIFEVGTNRSLLTVVKGEIVYDARF